MDDNYPFAARQQAIETRQRMLAEAIKQAQQGFMPLGGQMVSGHYVAPSWASSLSNALDPLVKQKQADIQSAQLTQMVNEYAQADQAAAMQHIANRPQGNQLPPDLAGPTSPPTELERMQWIAKGMNVPSRKDLMGKLLQDVELNDPIRKQAQQQHERELQMRLEEFKQGRSDRMELGREAIAERSEQAAANRQAQAQRDKDAADLRRELAAQNNAIRREAIAANLDRAEKAAKPEKLSKLGETQAINASNATESLELLKSAKKLIPGSTGSYIGEGVDQTARAFGIGTSGAQNAAQLKALAANLILKMPKLSGPQSDKDVILYKEAAAQIGDSTLPNSTKSAALKTIEEIFQRNSLGGATGSWDTPAPAPTGVRRFNPATGRLE